MHIQMAQGPSLSREPSGLYVDDVGNQNQVRQLRLSAHQPRIKVRRWIPRVAPHRSSRELVGLKSYLGVLYTSLYVVIATEWWHFLFLPVHFLMGPIHGAIVNWCGHRYGYQNFDNNR